MPEENTDCLYTHVKNVSGKERVFGYLGPRGMRLAANEVVTLPGNLVDALGNGGHWSQQKFKALERSLTVNASLEILATPAVHLHDAVLDETKMLVLQGGVLGVVDPCWAPVVSESSSSSLGSLSSA